MLKYFKFKLVIALCFCLSGCNNYKTIDGVTYGTYGLLNQTQMQNPGIEYQVSIGSLVAGVLFFETIVVPIYIFGFDIMEPIGKSSNYVKGRVYP